MKNFDKHRESLRYLNRLKYVERGGRVENRKESSAEHVWNVINIIMYFYTQFEELKYLDVSRLINIAIFHELVEIEVGDTFILDEKNKKTQSKREFNAIGNVTKHLFGKHSEKYKKYALEFENQGSDEARFVKAIDQLEPMIHWLDYKEDWKAAGFTQEILVNKKRMYMESFGPVIEFFDGLVDYLVENSYIS